LQGVEAYYRPPYHNLRHPMVFYYGHPAVLYINKLRVAGLLTEPVNEYFEHIFETGVDEMAWDDLSKNDMLWPMVLVHFPPQLCPHSFSAGSRLLMTLYSLALLQSSPGGSWS
jgi:hypothetical protein